MNRRYLVAALVCFCAACVCWATFIRIGSSVDQQGFLHEPFGLIPLGWLLGFAGLGLLVAARIRRK